MKYLLSILSLTLLPPGIPCFAQKIRMYTQYTTEKEGGALAGISLQYAPVQLLIQGAAASLGPVSENTPAFSLNNWGLRVKPADFLSFSIGSISAGGIVSRVKQPVPAIWNPLRKAVLPETGFSPTLPGVSAGTMQPVSAAIKVSAGCAESGAESGAEFGLFITPPDISVMSASGGNTENRFGWETEETGRDTFREGQLFPMYSVLTLYLPTPPRIKRWNISLFGGTAPVSPDEQDVWFRRRGWFYKENSVYTAAECALQTEQNIFFISGGVMKHPAGGFSGYIRTEGALTGQAASVAAVFSFTDPEYISFSGKTPDIIRTQLNPHLTLSGKKISFRLGLTADMCLRRNSSFSSLPCTTETFRLEAQFSVPAARITFRTELKDCAAGTGISLAGIFTPRPVGSSRFRISTETVFFPPYGTLRRSWSFAGLFEAYPAADAGKEKKILTAETVFSAHPLSFLSFDCTVLYTEKISAKTRSIKFEHGCHFSAGNGKTGQSLNVTFSAERGLNSKDDRPLFEASAGYTLNFTL
jgi:hypothetical protein